MIPNHHLLRETYLALLNEACFSEMHALCEHIYQQADTESSYAVAAVSLLGMSTGCLAAGCSDLSETYARRALYFAELSQDVRVICDVLVELGELEIISNGQYIVAQEYLERALSLARQSDYAEGYAATLRVIGMNHLQQHQTQAAFACLKQSFANALLTADKRLQALSANALGNWYLNNAQPDQAIECFRLAVEYCQVAGDRVNEVTMLCNLGRTFAQHTTFSTYHIAFTYFEKALALARDLRFSYAEISVLDAIGWTYLTHQQPERALHYLQQGADLANSTENDTLVIIVLDHLISAYLAMSDTSHAISTCKLWIQVFKRTGNYLQVVEKTLRLAEFYRVAGEVQQQNFYLAEAFRISRAHHLKGYQYIAPTQSFTRPWATFLGNQTVK